MGVFIGTTENSVATLEGRGRQHGKIVAGEIRHGNEIKQEIREFRG